MSNSLNVFFDTETLIVNEKAKPRLRKACVYVVSYEYWDTWDTGEPVKKIAPTLQDMLEDLCTLGYVKIWEQFIKVIPTFKYYRRIIADIL